MFTDAVLPYINRKDAFRMDKNLKKEIRKCSNINSLTIIVFYAIMFIGAILSPLITRIFISPKSEYFYGTETLISYLIIYVIGVPLILLMAKAMRKNGFKLRDGYVKPKQSAGWVFKWIIIILGMTYIASFLSSFLFTFIQSLTGIELHPAKITADDNWVSKCGTFISVVVLAPVFEEMLFRASIYRSTRNYGTWSMIILGGITFGLWHGNYEQTIYTATLGIFACFLTAKTGSVIPPMILHFCLNLIGGLELVLIDMDAISEISSGDSSAVFYNLSDMFCLMVFELLIIGLMIAGFILLIIEICCHRESFRVENTMPGVNGFRKFFTYITAPCTLIMFAGLTLFTVWRAVA